RRAWLHVVVRDAGGRAVFESGATNLDGSIQGNEKDGGALKFEPHYDEIRSADQVQIYETIIAGADGAVTTGLLKGVRYPKDNRLLPRGFDKPTPEPDAALPGAAAGGWPRCDGFGEGCAISEGQPAPAARLRQAHRRARRRRARRRGGRCRFRRCGRP